MLPFRKKSAFNLIINSEIMNMWEETNASKNETGRLVWFFFNIYYIEKQI
jgi:hypothetical protein